MTEQEYVDVANLTNVRAALHLILDCLFDEDSAADKHAMDAKRSIIKVRDALEKRVRTQEAEDGQM